MHSSSPRRDTGGTAGPAGCREGTQSPGPLSGMLGAGCPLCLEQRTTVRGFLRCPEAGRSQKGKGHSAEMGSVAGGARSPATGPETGSTRNGTSLAHPAGTSVGTVGTQMSPQADLPCCDAGLHFRRQSGMSSSKTSGIRRGKTPVTFPGDVRLMRMHHGLRTDSLPPADGFSPCNLSWLFISSGWIASTPKVFGHLEEFCLASAFLSESGRKAEYQFTYSLPILSSTQTRLPDTKTKPCSPVFPPPQGCRWAPSLCWIWGEREGF